jgi:hypothetical protein
MKGLPVTSALPAFDCSISDQRLLKAKDHPNAHQSDAEEEKRHRNGEREKSNDIFDNTGHWHRDVLFAGRVAVFAAVGLPLFYEVRIFRKRQYVGFVCPGRSADDKSKAVRVSEGISETDSGVPLEQRPDGAANEPEHRKNHP